MARQSPCPPMGDINNDGYVTKEDASLVAQYLTHSITLTSEEISRACVTAESHESGQPTAVDALLIARYDLGIIDTFPACQFVPPPTGKWGWGILALVLGFMMIRRKKKKK